MSSKEKQFNSSSDKYNNKSNNSFKSNSKDNSKIDVKKFDKSYNNCSQCGKDGKCTNSGNNCGKRNNW